MSAEKELNAINEMMLEGQGDDEGAQILPDFTEGMSVLGKVEACLALLEYRRDVIEGFERSNPSLENKRPSESEARSAVEAWQDLIETSGVNSPAEYPNHALITFEQLRDYMSSASQPTL
jgi:hypothetical protein